MKQWSKSVDGGLILVFEGSDARGFEGRLNYGVFLSTLPAEGC
jgi:hypothetical protein